MIQLCQADSCYQGWSATTTCPFRSPYANTGTFAKWRITGWQNIVGKKQLYRWKFCFSLAFSLKSRKVGWMNNASWQWPEVRLSYPDNKAASPSAVRWLCSNQEHRLKVQLHLTEGNSRLCQSVYFPQTHAPTASKHCIELWATCRSHLNQELNKERAGAPSQDRATYPAQSLGSHGEAALQERRVQNNWCKLSPLVNLF